MTARTNTRKKVARERKKSTRANAEFARAWAKLNKPVAAKFVVQVEVTTRNP